MKTVLLAFLALGVSGCTLTNPTPRQRDPDDDEAILISPVGVTNANLAPSEPPGSVRIVEEPLREVEGVSSGRTWLLELYQEALAAKEDLARRLETSELDLTTTKTSQTALITEHASLTARCTDLDQRVRELESQTLDLARRLAESEIARLEAQKAELERESRSDRKERP